MGRINAKAQSKVTKSSTFDQNHANNNIDDNKKSKLLTFIPRGKYKVVQVGLTLCCLFYGYSVYNDGNARNPLSRSTNAVQLMQVSDNDDKCSALWRPDDNLNTRCTGLTKILENSEENKSDITNADKCKAFCCEMGDKCVSWQWQKSGENHGCYWGGPVKVGLEVADTTNSCPAIAKAWEGQIVSLRETTDEGKRKCVFEEQTLTTQCSGLQAYFFRSAPGGLRINMKSREQCQKKCCQNDHSECKMWQFNEEDGCFIGSADYKSDSCEEPWVGGRKCIKGFCGGLEDQILKSS